MVKYKSILIIDFDILAKINRNQYSMPNRVLGSTSNFS